MRFMFFIIAGFVCALLLLDNATNHGRYTDAVTGFFFR